MTVIFSFLCCSQCVFVCVCVCVFVCVCVCVGGGGVWTQGKSIAKVRLNFSLIFRQAEFSPFFKCFTVCLCSVGPFWISKTYENRKREERKKTVWIPPITIPERAVYPTRDFQLILSEILWQIIHLFFVLFTDFAIKKDKFNYFRIWVGWLCSNWNDVTVCWLFWSNFEKVQKTAFVIQGMASHRRPSVYKLEYLGHTHL